MRTEPPRLARLLVALAARRSDRRSVVEDLQEEFEALLAEGTPAQEARRWYWRQVLASVMPLMTTRAVERFRSVVGLGEGSRSGYTSEPDPRRRRAGGRWGGAGVSWLDVKLGLRMLVKHPGLTGAAVFALAVGIPVGLAPMHAANALQAPPPFDEGDRIKVLRNFDVSTSDREAPSLHDYMQWREECSGVRS